MLIAVIFTVFVAGLIYHVTKPPTTKICGSPNGPPVTSPRIRLRDSRYLAYKARGAMKEKAKYNVILTHGFSASKDTYIPVSDEWLQELGVCLITFDRPGYAESDPNPKRSPKTDAFDIQELVDQLELGPKTYIIGLSMGAYAVLGCLRYLPHRFAGVALVGPVINYWWPSLPSELCNKIYRRLPLPDQWRLWLVHHAPKLAWVLQQWFPTPTVDVILKKRPSTFCKSDLAIITTLCQMPAPDQHLILQQGAYESVHRDNVVEYGTWEFDPLKMSNPYGDKKERVHLWFGSEDGFVSVELLKHFSKRLPWMKRHEIPNAGHLVIHDKNTFEMILKSLVFGEKPYFELS